MALLNVYRLSEISKEDYERIMKRGQMDVESVMENVRKIIEDVRKRGDQALIEYEKKFDGAEIRDIQVSEDDIKTAYRKIDEKTKKAIEILMGNVRKFHAGQLPSEMWSMEISPGLIGGQVIRPLEVVGCYVPGGRGWFPTSVMMTVIPAKVAGVEKTIVCTPPAPDGSINPGTLVACDMTGADAVYKVGGAQAIAAMAYGTKTVPKVYKIVGPGSKYIMAAFDLVRKDVEIGCPAGPGEGLVLADERANPDYVAADVLIQVEHGTESTGVVVTTSQSLAEEVQKRVEEMVKKVPEYRRKFCIEALQKYGAIIVADTMEEAIKFVDDYAVEHLEIQTRDPVHIMKKIRNAGAFYLGDYTPLSTGCYGSGPNHVLPTGRYAKVTGGLSTADFVKRITFEYFSPEGLAYLKDPMVDLADYEGFYTHPDAIKKRFEK